MKSYYVLYYLIGRSYFERFWEDARSMDGPIEAPSPVHALALVVLPRYCEKDDTPEKLKTMTDWGVLRRIKRCWGEPYTLERRGDTLFWYGENLKAAVATSPSRATALFLRGENRKRKVMYWVVFKKYEDSSDYDRPTGWYYLTREAVTPLEALARAYYWDDMMAHCNRIFSEECMRKYFRDIMEIRIFKETTRTLCGADIPHVFGVAPTREEAIRLCREASRREGRDDTKGDRV